MQTTTERQIQQPPCRRCQMGRQMPTDSRCEDCWAIDQMRFSGRSQRAQIERTPLYEDNE